MFDYIVVGAGAAGCVLAARLSEDPSVRVLLLEAGPPDRKFEIRVPAAFPQLMGTPFDWGYSTEGGPYPRGKTLGGSTSINAQIYMRAPGFDYTRVEKTLSIQPLRDPSPHSRAFAKGMDGRLVEVTQRQGRRWSAADAYLRPALSRPNLTVVCDAEVLELAWADTRRVGGVAYRINGCREKALAREVIVCAGAIGTPVLLMRSGIGPAEHLRAHGIDVRHHLPAVGQDLADHPLVPIVFGCEFGSLKGAERQLLRYLLRRRGKLTSNIAEAIAFPKPGLELLFAPVTWVDQGLAKPVRHGITIGAVALDARSRGQVALSSDGVAIRPNHLAEPEDVAILADGVRLARAYGGEELAPTAGLSDEEAVRAVVQTLYHPMGSCQVVDEEFRVDGLGGLRIVDASVIPLVPAHPQAAIYALAEGAAAAVKASAAARRSSGSWAAVATTRSRDVPSGTVGGRMA